VITGDDPPPLQGSPHLDGLRGHSMAAGPPAAERDLAAGPGAAGAKDSIARPRSYALHDRITASNGARSPAAGTVVATGGQRYGLPVEDVRELLRAVTITPLQRAPAVVEGIVNVRGNVVPVFDVRRRFRQLAQPPAHTDHLILAVVAGRPVALRVDRAFELVSLADSAVDRGEVMLPGVEYIIQVAKCADGPVLIHDLDTFLSASDIALLAKGARRRGRPRPSSIYVGFHPVGFKDRPTWRRR
jgi:purine-binding chemotaxis protein CheW